MSDLTVTGLVSIPVRTALFPTSTRHMAWLHVPHTCSVPIGRRHVSRTQGPSLSPFHKRLAILSSSGPSLDGYILSIVGLGIATSRVLARVSNFRCR
jgi:hypothetical protein